MTMIMTLSNRDNVILISDRRLTLNGMVFEEDWGKSGTMIFEKARFAFAFTGIAKAPGIDIRRFILDSLFNSGPPDYEIPKTFERFKIRITDLFKTNPVLKALDPSTKRLSIVFTGYLYFHDPPMIGCAIISNYQNPKIQASSEVAWEGFESSYTNEKSPRSNKVSVVQSFGAWRAMNQSDVDALKYMLEERKPCNAIISKAITIMHKMADRSEARGLIGKQITWIRIPTDSSEAIETGYHSNIISHATYMPSTVIIKDKNNRTVIDEIVIEAVDPNSTVPMHYPNTWKNAPCTCGSGKKYKNCHGRNRS